MTIGSQTETPLFSAIKAAKELADSTHNDFGTVNPTILKTRLLAISHICTEALKLQPAPLPPIEYASDIEKQIVGKLVTDLLAAGYKLRVYDGEDYATGWTDDAAAIYAALASTDMDRLDACKDAKMVAWVMLVWGNDTSVISDYTTSLTDVLKPVNSLCDELEARS